MIYFDRYIEEYQKYGGIKTYFTQLQRSMTGCYNKVSIPMWRYVLNKPPSFGGTKKNVVHSSYYFAFKAQSDVKCVVTVHDFMPEKSWTGVQLHRHRIMKRTAFLRCSGLIFINRHLREEFLMYYPEFINKAYTIIPHGVDHFKEQDTLAEESQSGNNFIYFGSLGEFKNFVFLLDVFQKCRDLNLHCYGFDKKELHIYAKSKGRDVPFNVKTHGRVPTSQLKLAISRATASIIPSLDEGFGFPAFESIMLGTPSLVNKIPAFTEYLDEACSFTVQNPASLIKKLYEMQNTRYREDLLSKQMAEVKGLTWNESAKKHEQFYRSLWT